MASEQDSIPPSEPEREPISPHTPAIEELFRESPRLNPETFDIKAETGWDNFTEFLLDISGLVPKPNIMAGISEALEEDVAFEDQSNTHETISKTENIALKSLAEVGYDDNTINEYRKDVELYRGKIRSIVSQWRKIGKL